MWVDFLSDGGEEGMEIASLCLTLSLVVQPDRSQFFVYEPITLTCGGPPGCAGGWTLQRNTSTRASQPCPSGWGVSANRSTCVIEDAYPSDSGVYWCGSELRGSNGVNITVTDSGVILQSPALPVTEGDRVTLLCASAGGGGAARRGGEPQPAAFFYKDGVMIGNRSAANVTFAKVSRSDAGFYRCELPTRGKSPRSWLEVRAGPAETPPLLPRLVCVVLLIVLLVLLHILSFGVCVKVQRKRAGRRKASGNPQS